MSTGSNSKPVDQIADTEGDQSRLRVSKACTRCRTRKDRCDGIKPCTSCRVADKPCVYEQTTKKRGLPEGYVRGLEKLTTLACQTIEGLEDVLIGYLSDDEARDCWNASAGDELWSNWKESGIHQQLEEFLQATTSSGNKRKRTDEESDSPGGRLDTLLEHLRNSRRRVIQGSDDVQPQINGALPSMFTEGQATPGNTEVLPGNSKQLINLYFTNVHCWFPILDRPSVLKAYYGQSRRTPDQKRLDGGQALLWALFAYAVLIDPDVIPNERSTLSQQYSELSLKHIPTPYTNAEDVQDFDIMQAQALIVLSLLRLGNGQWLGAWMCTGRAVRILLAKEATKSRKGALQGCFILETLLNVHFENTEPLFPRGLIDEVEAMVDEDGYEEWETWNSTGTDPSFSLSIFNRLTRVFLVLHEVITEPSAASQPAYIRSKLTTIHNLAQAHFNSGISHPTVQSPPHHVYFHIGLLFAQLRLVSRLSGTESAQFDLTSLATNVLGLFEICEKSAHIGLTKVPPLFADILNLAIAVASRARASFGLSASSPSYQEFATTIFEFRSRLTAIWASFRSNSTDTDELPALGVLPGADLSNDYSLDFQISGVAIGNCVSDPSTSTPTVTGSHQSIPQWTPNAVIESPAMAQNRNSFSQATLPALPRMQSYDAFPTTSPSFTGDEVDAIFHEMAHLDTNEWTMDRTTHLRDFGFPDESAFMEFCNDPERLALPENNMALSSSRQTWTFAEQPP